MDNVVSFKPKNTPEKSGTSTKVIPFHKKSDQLALYEKITDVLASQYGNLFSAPLLSDNADVHTIFPMGFDDEAAMRIYNFIIESTMAGNGVGVPIVLIFNGQIEKTEIKDMFLGGFKPAEELTVDLTDTRSFQYMEFFSAIFENLTDLANELGQPMPQFTWFKNDQDRYRAIVGYQDFSIIQLFTGVDYVP